MAITIYRILLCDISIRQPPPWLTKARVGNVKIDIKETTFRIVKGL